MQVFRSSRIELVPFVFVVVAAVVGAAVRALPRAVPPEFVVPSVRR